jgi:uncharacterized membrane protein
LKGHLIVTNKSGLLALLAGIGLGFLALVLTGCDRSGSAGGPGATGSGTKPPMYGEADNTFNLTTSSVSIKQGDAEKGTIGIKRGTNFDQDVAITLADIPTGVTVEPSSLAIRHGDTDAKFTLKAADNAAPGDYTVKVTGHPAKGADAANQFKVTVAKKDSFTLSPSFWTTGLKQGETKAVAVGVHREKRFDQEVTLKISGLPKGVTAEPSTIVIKPGDAEAKFALKASDDASIGDFTATLTGHPAAGADATHEFKFSVAKK